MAEKVEVFPFIDDFGSDFQDILSKAFSGSDLIKNLGDGAMIILEIKGKTSLELLKNTLLVTIKNINKVEKEFKELCKDYSLSHGCKINLLLGWGVTKGSIKKCKEDYIGADINKSARLCGIARPFGIVIDKDDFPVIPILPKNIDIKFYLQVRKLKGIFDDVDVWVTKSIANQLITREHIRQTPEVHVAGICLKLENGLIKALMAKRSHSRKLYPNLYEECVGQLAPDEDFITGVVRHFKLELGIDVDVNEEVHKFYYIQQPNEPIIPGIKYLCKYVNGNPSSENHSEVKWATEEEIKRIPKEKFIPGLKEDFLEFIETFKKLE